MSANTASPSKKSTNVAEPCRHYEIGHDSGESALSEILTSATGCPLENMRELPVDAVGLGASAGCLPKRARAYQLSSRTLTVSTCCWNVAGLPSATVSASATIWSGTAAN
jgi:hypothetical protein